MSPCIRLDTYPDFLRFWQTARTMPVAIAVEKWASEYMAPWPELRRQQQESFTDQREDWRAVAAERVFPGLDTRLPGMAMAHAHLLELCEPSLRKAQTALGFESDMVFVLYVGIGCGAGWATAYEGRPAILLGLEMIAECGWCDRPALAGLLAHEIGHLVQSHWRTQQNSPVSPSPYWQLFSEGFAQRCEHLILGTESWHQSQGLNQLDWVAWCRSHRSWLAGKFLACLDAKADTRPFFGSWFDIEGRKQCGYFLGHEVIKEMQAASDMRAIAVMDDFEGQSRAILQRFAEQGR